MATSDELLKQMYDSNLASQKAALQSDYDAAVADLNAQKAANQQQTQNNIRLAKTEADRSAVNTAEYYEAAGLSSGAKAQARVAQDNQLLADLTAIRAAQQQGDINIERQRGLLGQQFAAAIREAQANNDMARAQALYEQAKEAEANLLKQQQAEDAAKAQAAQDAFNQQLAYAKWLAENAGDDSLWKQLVFGTTDQGVVPNTQGTTQPGTITVPPVVMTPPKFSFQMFPSTTGNGLLPMRPSFAAGDTENPPSSSSDTDGLPSATEDSILALGGPLSPSTVAQMVANGEVIMDTDANGNTIFRKKQPFATAANNWGRGW